MEREIGTIEIGKKANLVMVDHRFHVKMTILEGEVWNKKE
jgi:N-acetylglucosamine-6-phosphate deacetylase